MCIMGFVARGCRASVAAMGIVAACTPTKGHTAGADAAARDVAGDEPADQLPVIEVHRKARKCTKRAPLPVHWDGGIGYPATWNQARDPAVWCADPAVPKSIFVCCTDPGGGVWVMIAEGHAAIFVYGADGKLAGIWESLGEETLCYGRVYENSPRCMEMKELQCRDR